MALEDDIMNAISNDLPNQIGSRLKARLQQAEDAEAELKDANLTIERVTKELDHLRRRDVHNLQLDEREAAVTDKEREMELREYKLTCREEYADKARGDMHMMMGTVFKCPDARQFAFNLYGNANGVTNAQGYSESPSVNLSGDISDKPAP